MYVESVCVLIRLQVSITLISDEIIGQYLSLDTDHNGMLNKTELSR